MTKVPLAPPVVRGLINLRGQIVTAIDLRRRLGLADRPTDSLPMNVVVRTDDGLVSLLVDEIGDVQEVPEEAFERPPETLDAAARAFIQAPTSWQAACCWCSTRNGLPACRLPRNNIPFCEVKYVGD